MTLAKYLRRRTLPFAPYVEPSRVRHALVRHKVLALRQGRTAGTSQYSVDELYALRCIFFHLPKTGGLSVSEALFGNHAAGHIDVETARLIFGAWRFRTFFKFCVVRNPWDRLVSAYHYLRKGHPKSPIAAIVKTAPTFDHFVKEALKLPHVSREMHIRPQSSFVLDRDGRLAVDFVGRFERLECDFQAIAHRLGVSRSLPVRNQSPHGDYRSYYDPESQAIAAEFYRTDIELFAYHFEPWSERQPAGECSF